MIATNEIGNGIGGHQSARMLSDVWLTPPEIMNALGSFDLDPCSPMNRPWDTARLHLTESDDGLSKPWMGRVWLNAPYGQQLGRWLDKLSRHRNGIAIVFARTETRDWFNYIWCRADAILFIKGRLYFHREDGVRASANSGAPSALVAYGKNNVEALRHSGIKGALVTEWKL